VAAVQFMQGDLAAECIPMEPEQLRGIGLIAIGFLQSQLYEFLFELSDCFVEVNALLDHLAYQLVQLLSHESTF